LRTLPSVIAGALALSLAAVFPAAQAVAAPSVPNVVEPTAEGTFHPLSPSRILDTRSGLGAPDAPVGSGATISLQINGRGGVPASGVLAVVLNVTATAASQETYVSVYPSGVERPLASSLNATVGWTGANAVTTGVGADGKVNLFNAVGSIELIADVTGYFAKSDIAGGIAGSAEYLPIEPHRAYDSREDPLGILLPGETVQIFGVNYGPFTEHIKGFAINVTAVLPTGHGYLTTWNGDLDNRPLASTLNYQPGEIVANMAIVPTRPCTYDECEQYEGSPSYGVFTWASSHVIVDIVGIFVETAETVDESLLRFGPITPNRIADTRTATPGPAGVVGQGETRTIPVPSTVGTDATVALATNLTGILPTQQTFLAVWPTGDRPLVSNLNPAPMTVDPNATITGIYGEPGDRSFLLFNAVGSVHAAIDVVGHYYFLDGGVANAKGGNRVLPNIGKPAVGSTR
jgi:hypothetical protein